MIPNHASASSRKNKQALGFGGPGGWAWACASAPCQCKANVQASQSLALRSSSPEELRVALGIRLPKQQLDRSGEEYQGSHTDATLT